MILTLTLALKLSYVEIVFLYRIMCSGERIGLVLPLQLVRRRSCQPLVLSLVLDSSACRLPAMSMIISYLQADASAADPLAPDYLIL